MNLSMRINLLDWRAAEREYKRRRFLVQIVGAAVITSLLVGVLPVLYYDHLISAQQARNHYLQKQIDIADHQLAQIKSLKKKKRALVDRMQVIGQLQHTRSAIVHFFDQIEATIPDGVYLTSLNEKGKTTTLQGIAESNARVSEYMTNLNNSAWFTNPRLIVIKRGTTNSKSRADFTLEVDNGAPGASSQNNTNGSGQSTQGGHG